MRKLWTGFVPIVCTFVPVLALLLVQEHLSAMMITAVILAVLLLVGGANLFYLLLSGVGGAALAGMYAFSTEFRRRRLMIFLDPWQDSLGSGWQIIQSLYAISTRWYFWRRTWTRRSKVYVYIRTTK